MKNQEGDISYIEDTEKFQKASIIEPIYSNSEGYIKGINAKEIGKLACELGAGRIKKEDKKISRRYGECHQRITER